MAEDTDFGALYRELGIDSTCSLAELRGAWRRRVSKLHPDQGGSAEDTGQLQQLNRLYDAALDFHTRYRRMPGAMPAGHLSPMRPESSPRGTASAGDLHRNALPASGFGKLSRYFVAVSLVAVVVLGWRVVDTAGAEGDRSGEAFVDMDPVDVGLVDTDLVDAGAVDSDQVDRDRADTDRWAAVDTRSDRGKLSAQARTAPSTATRLIAQGMQKNTVRDILGEPLDMQASRWTYGPSWVDFRCDKVVGWYSSPLRPLHVSAARDASADARPADDRDCR